MCSSDLEAFAHHVQREGGKASLLAPRGQAFDDLAAVEAALKKAIADNGPVQRVLFGLSLEQADALASVRAAVVLWQALGRLEATAGVRLVAMTSAAATVQEEAVQRPGPAAIAGLLRVVPREFPNVRTRTVRSEEHTSETPVTL